MKFLIPIGDYWANLALFHYRSKQYLYCRKIECQFYEKRQIDGTNNLHMTLVRSSLKDENLYEICFDVMRI
jgi:hypothetical protein